MNKKGQKPSPLSLKDTTNTLGFKVYPEQCSGGFDNTLRNVIKLDNHIYEAYAIIHVRDGKSHLHIGLRLKNGKTKRVSYLLGLLGIKFRDEDATLLMNRGLETLGGFRTYLRYLTHTDKKSIKANKKRYDLSEFVTNMDRTLFSSLLGNNIKAKKLTKTERLQIDCREAKNAGYDLWNYRRWLETKEFDFIRYNNKDLNNIKKFFKDGQVRRFFDKLPQITIVIDIPQDLEIPIQNLTSILWNALRDNHIYIETTLDINNNDSSELNNNVGLGRIVRLQSLLDKTNYKNIDAIMSTDDINKASEKINNVIKEASDPVKLHCDPYYLEKGGMTYTIVIADDPRSFSLLMAVKNKSYYLCTIDIESNNLVFQDADTHGDQQYQQGRKDLYVQFRDAFNLRIRSFAIDSTNSKQISNQVVDYSDL